MEITDLPTQTPQCQPRCMDVYVMDLVDKYVKLNEKNIVEHKLKRISIKSFKVTYPSDKEIAGLPPAIILNINAYIAVKAKLFLETT